MADALAEDLRTRRHLPAAAIGSPWAPVVTGLGLAVVAALTWIQWWRPYIEHDDWDMLLPNGPSFVENHATRLLYEGRWLNDWWWSLGSQALSPRGAALLYAAGWLVVVAVVVRSFAIGWWSVPAAAAIYAAPMMSMLSYWPATLAAPMWMTAVTSALLWLTRERWAIHLAVLAVGMILICLGYPPLALLPLALLVALHHRRSWRRLAALGAVVVTSYVGAILIVFTLNAIRFGDFGLRIQPWRHPSALSGLSSLSHHVATVERNWGSAIRPSTLPLIAALIALVAGLVEPRMRRRMLVLGLALVGGAALSAASTITNGVDVPSRAMGWCWPILVLAAAWGVTATRWSARVIAGLALVLIAGWSTAYAADATLGHQPELTALDQMRAAIVAHHEVDPDARIIVALPSRQPTAAERQAVWEVGNALAKFDHIAIVHQCVGCRLAHGYADPRHTATWVHDVKDTIVVQFPPSIDRAHLRAWAEPRWLVPFR